MARCRLSLFLVLVLAAGCAPAVGVHPLEPREANLALTANVLNSPAPSADAAAFLYRANLSGLYRTRPQEALAVLHAGLGQRDESDRLYALAELSYGHALRSGDRSYHLAAALYAWLFLFPQDSRVGPGPYDSRIRVAMDLYNRGLAEGLADAGDELDLSPRTQALPFGTLELRSDAAGLRYAGYELTRFVSLAGLETEGFRNRYRHRGIGAALAGSVRKTGDTRVDQFIGPRSKVPMTLVLRFHDGRKALARGAVRGTLELYDPEMRKNIDIAGRTVPLESELSAALAYRLSGSPLWDFEIAGFRRGEFEREGEIRSNLYMLRPYQRGRIPVVFVHGTASSPARWAEMTNELVNDPVLSGRFQFWYFLYNTGNPVAYSALALRKALTDAVAAVDPAGTDPALRRMVVIGHSQGGLLTKMTAIDSGDSFWSAISNVPFEEADLSPESRALLSEGLFIEPLPFVRRLIFIATPHRGSVLAGNIVSNLIRRIVSLPGRLISLGPELLRLQSTGALKRANVPTSIDNMTPSNPFLVTLAELPIVPGVRAHSIIPVAGDGPPELGDDGVVAYSSAHIEGVDSELVVSSKHSTQAVPETIEEVRRILYVHLEAK